MNTKQKNKINLFFSGFSEKYNSYKDYFVALRWQTVSGKRSYNGNAELDKISGNFLYSFAGTKIYDTINELLDSLVDVILTYDSAKVEYIERGRITTVYIDDRNVKLEKKDIENDILVSNGLKDKDYHINLRTAVPLLKVLGFMTEDGKIKNDMIRKYNQTDRFLDLIGDMFDGQNNMTIVDCACGKSYLSFILNYYLWEQRHVKAEFIGIDIKQTIIEESTAMAEKLGYKNMKFICGDLRYFDEVKPDTVISLHACDTATDMSLGFAIRNGAKNIICIPCCHKELLDKYKKSDLDGIIKHGVFRARLNDLLTDGLRCMKLESCGYKVSCVEYCSPLDTPKNLLIKAQKISDYNPKADEEYHKLLSELAVMPAIEYYSIQCEEE